MAKFLITGGKKLSGEVEVAGFKNAVLPVLAATLLTKDECVIDNVPEISDVDVFLQMLSELGSSIERVDGQVKISTKELTGKQSDKDKVGSMRGSVVLLGALLARHGHVELPYPGGDKIGARPIDIHLRAFKEMGATVESGDKVKISCPKLKGASVFAGSSVTGTENILLASVLADGATTINAAAMEPHVVQLCEFLKLMGASIAGIGTPVLKIIGVTSLHGAHTRIIPDMLEAGTFAVLAAATRSFITIKGVVHEHLEAFYHVLSLIGVAFDKAPGTLIIKSPKEAYRATSIRTGVFPNLATDLQPPLGVLATQCEGISLIHDWIFEGRFGYLKQLEKMGAKISLIDPHEAEITGPTQLKAASISCSDIRNGITLLIAALIATGTSELSEIQHIDRGYEHIERKLTQLGVSIIRTE